MRCAPFTTPTGDSTCAGSGTTHRPAAPTCAGSPPGSSAATLVIDQGTAAVSLGDPLPFEASCAAAAVAEDGDDQPGVPDWLLTSAELDALAAAAPPRHVRTDPDGRRWLLDARGTLFDRAKTSLVDWHDQTWILLDAQPITGLDSTKATTNTTPTRWSTPPPSTGSGFPILNPPPTLTMHTFAMLGTEQTGSASHPSDDVDPSL